MNRKSRRGFLIGALLLGVPTAVWAYVDCLQVINVYPNGTVTQCKICEIYSNVDGSWQGEISNCGGGGTHGSPV